MSRSLWFLVISSSAYLALLFVAFPVQAGTAYPGASSDYHYSNWLNPACSALTIQGTRLYEAIPELDHHGVDSKVFAEQFREIVGGERPCMEKHAALDQWVARIVAGLAHGFAKTARQSRDILNDYTIRKHVTLLSHEYDVGAHWDRIAGTHAAYTGLKNALQTYRMLGQSGGLPRIAEQGGAIKPGAKDARVHPIRHLLYLTGDYVYRNVDMIPNARNEEAMRQPAPYDEALQEAVARFQKRHGLEDDGVIGMQTIATMNIPLRKRVEQIQLSMERLRQLNFDQEDYIHVNIPGYTLTAYEQGEPALRMRVIVGKKDRRTPEFENKVTGLVFNPTWTPTTNIMKKDLLPKIRNNPEHANGYQFFDRFTGEELVAEEVDWESVSAQDIRIRQPSGRGNALGKIKFVLPDSDAIYLHDTAKPYLFKRAERALSSGCVRVEKPKALARYVMQQQSSSVLSKLDRWYDGRDNRHISMQSPVPVYTTYLTAWVNDEGRPEFYKDVYGKDAALRTALNDALTPDGSFSVASR